ncbi:LysR family transcriptional regulator [Xylophilus sp. GOD-11R]|uniref:LysR family transcriptional regulator n=1 Tax=Xylophilus sp. GOD-11R TaxID=3089814 RepID=UPI00298C60AA|nr:LysR family transcriptional regulator [Xylophilus sp. GOD-11R]WPB58038.1 LysR family transcriptional regulator [Xylophilus sp. GOD-11R]
MDPQSLLLFVDIVEAQNLSEAARRLRMTRANVSYRLNRLEKELGVQLMRRTTRSAEPTEAGLRLFEHGKAMQRELMAAKDSLATLAGTVQGRLRVSVPSGYGQIVMGEWLIDFKRRFPGVLLDVAFESRVSDLLREELDFTVQILPHPPGGMVAHLLGEVRYVACASTDYVAAHGLPRSLEDLGGAPVITSDVVGRELRLAGYRGEERKEVLLTPALVSENFVFLRDATLAGLGVGLVPEYLVQQAVADGRMQTCLDDWRLSIFGTRMYLLYMPNRHPTRAASAFIEFIVGKAQAA